MKCVKGLGQQGSVRPSLQGHKVDLEEEDLVQGRLYSQGLPVSSTVLEEVLYVQPRTVLLAVASSSFTGTSGSSWSPAHLGSVSIEPKGRQTFLSA